MCMSISGTEKVVKNLSNCQFLYTLTSCVCVCVQVKVNFPMPPALQMLQDLLGGDSSSDEDEVVDKPESGIPLT